ncbi:MAG: monovalent cation/H(+) antiporter subunit G [Deltaproteobacteria bacterium]|nr:monovalent cation/H(+) antiporter subunit G [Deltaproteobacteria bacterium]
MWIDWIVVILLSIGAFFMLVAAIGVVRLPDLYQRLHASTKASTLGVAFILLAVALDAREVGVVTRCVVAIVFFILTAPVGSHLIARAAIRAGEPLDKKTLSNEWPLPTPADKKETPSPEKK